MRAVLLFVLIVAFAAPTLAQTLQSAFPDLPPGSIINPTDIQAPADGSNRLFVVQKNGSITVFQNDPAVATSGSFLDIHERVRSGVEGGLLGLAFDPDYAQNGYFYLYYTARVGPYRSVVARYSVSETDPNQADPDSEVVLFQVLQPGQTHNAGQLQFGPPEGPGGERYLYVALGDGTCCNDPGGHGQDPSTVLGAVLRLDVSGGGLPLDCGAGTGAATVPPDNPFVGQAGSCDEIYAYGFRNPWRFSFGPDGRLWLADVGQGRREEVNVVTAGGNYGWKMYEGTFCFDGPCDPTGKEFPVHEYPHAFSTSGGFAVIGGYVYTGNNCADLRGRYVYGDYITGNVWALTYDGATATNDLVVGLSGQRFSTFGRDEQGEVFVASIDSGILFRFGCERPVTVEEPSTAAPPAGDAARFVAAPNPFGEGTTVRFLLREASHVQVEVLDLLGRRVALLGDGWAEAGAHDVRWAPRDLPAGTYLVRIATEETVQTLHVTHLR